MPSIGDSKISRRFTFAGSGVKPAFVERLGNKLAHGRMKPPRVVEENAPVRSDRGLVAEQEVQNRQAGLARMDALNRLAELHLVADQHDVASGGPHRNDVRNRNLTGLVDEQVIEMPVESFMSK